MASTHPRGAQFIKATVLVIGALLLFAPFLFQDTRSLEVAARICIFVVLVASYDLLIGYTGIVSFAHTMFFGFGAYGAAIALRQMGPGWDAVLVGSLAGLTGGEDGITYRAPQIFKTATKLMVDENGKVVRILGVKLNGKLAAYYFVFASSLALFILCLRIVGSPLGSVLKAIRENEARAEAIGYRVVAYRTFVFCIAAAAASLAGTIYAIWLKYTGPDTALSFNIMIDILLMVVIGGMGTMYGAVIGAVLLVLAQYYLRDLMGVVSENLHGIPLLPELFEPSRWLLWLGIIFILLVYFFPKGIAGTIWEKGARS